MRLPLLALALPFNSSELAFDVDPNALATTDVEIANWLSQHGYSPLSVQRTPQDGTYIFMRSDTLLTILGAQELRRNLHAHQTSTPIALVFRVSRDTYTAVRVITLGPTEGAPRLATHTLPEFLRDHAQDVFDASCLERRILTNQYILRPAQPAATTSRPTTSRASTRPAFRANTCEFTTAPPPARTTSATTTSTSQPTRAPAPHVPGERRAQASTSRREHSSIPAPLKRHLSAPEPSRILATRAPTASMIELYERWPRVISITRWRTM